MNITNGRSGVWALCTILGGFVSASTSTQADWNENNSFFHCPNQDTQGAQGPLRSSMRTPASLNPWKRNSKKEALIQKVVFIFNKRLNYFPKSQIPQLAEHFVALCQYYSFDPSFILGVIEVESSFRSGAQSEKDAIGLMQVLVSTAGYVVDNLGVVRTGYEISRSFELNGGALTPQLLADPFFNLSVGVRYLAWLRENYKERSSPYYMLAAYNMGPARMNQLLRRKTFTPVESKRYFLSIQRAALGFQEFLEPIKSPYPTVVGCPIAS